MTVEFLAAVLAEHRRMVAFLRMDAILFLLCSRFVADLCFALPIIRERSVKDWAHPLSRISPAALSLFLGYDRRGIAQADC